MLPITAATATAQPPSIPARSITISAWRDELVEKHPDSIAVHSEDMLIWWTPILGPTATLMAHQFARLVRDGTPHTFARADLGLTFGLGSKSGRLDAGLGRLHRFGAAHVQTDQVAVRLAMPPMSVRKLSRLPAYLAVAYGHRS